MNLTSAEKEFLTQTLRKYFPQSEYNFLLFGSYVKGTARPSSDIDIAIKGQEPVEASQWQKAISELEDSTFPKKVDLVDYHRVSESFQKIILRDGQFIA